MVKNLISAQDANSNKYGIHMHFVYHLFLLQSLQEFSSTSEDEFFFKSEDSLKNREIL